MKEFKIKEKWIYGALDRLMEERDGIKMAFSILTDKLQRINSDEIDVWSEVDKRYKLDTGKKYIYRKKGHTIQESFERAKELPWARKHGAEK